MNTQLQLSCKTQPSSGLLRSLRRNFCLSIMGGGGGKGGLAGVERLKPGARQTLWGSLEALKKHSHPPIPTVNQLNISYYCLTITNRLIMCNYLPHHLTRCWGRRVFGYQFLGWRKAGWKDTMRFELYLPLGSRITLMDITISIRGFSCICWPSSRPDSSIIVFSTNDRDLHPQYLA